MRFRLIFLTVLLLCLSAGIASAQDSNFSASTIATSIDASASVYGLPSGNGSISAAEQNLGAVAQAQVENFSTQVEAAAAASPSDAAAIDSIDANVSSGTFDPRAWGISNAVEQYGMTPDQLAIHNAVTWGYGDPFPHQEPPAPPANPARLSPDAQAISDAVAQYGVENAHAQGKDSLTPAEQQNVRSSVRDGINRAVDQSSLKHKSLVKKHMQHLIEYEVPSQTLPINGYWRVKPFSMSSSGHCIVDNGDNGGPDGNGDTEIDPGRPLCGYANAPSLPFINWDGDDLPYLPGTGSIYSPAQIVTYDLVRDSSGQSTSSVKITTTREYRVVSPSEIRVHLVIAEDGGCTMTADYVLELVTPDDSICAESKPLSTPEPTEPPPPAEQGPLHAALPLYNDETECDDSNRPPAIDEVYLRAQSGGMMVVDYGVGQITTFKDGWHNYTYDSGNQNGGRLTFGLSLYGSGGSLFWSKKSDADLGKLCVASIDLISPESEAAGTPTPEPSANEAGDADSQTGETGDSDASSFVLPTGSFDVTWSEYPGLTCAPALASQLPKFAEAIIAEAGGTFTVNGGGANYPLIDQSGNYLYMVFNADNSGVVMAFNGLDPDGNVIGSYMVVGADNTNCMNMLTLKPK